MPEILTFDSPLAAAEACGDQDSGTDGRGTAANAARRRWPSRAETRRGSCSNGWREQPFDWSGIELFQVDERCVPVDSDQSNYRMMRESLLDAARIPAKQVHRVQTELAPEAAAQKYADDDSRDSEARAGRTAGVRCDPAWDGAGWTHGESVPRRAAGGRPHRVSGARFGWRSSNSIA